jgi:casein kinase II subunit beta
MMLYGQKELGKVLTQEIIMFRHRAHKELPMSSWISWFLSQPEGSLFVEVDRQFITSESEHSTLVALFHPSDLQCAVDTVLGLSVESDAHSNPKAKLLYGLLHRRFLLTDAGLAKMLERHRRGAFPACARVLCQGFCCLPCSLSDEDLNSPVKIFCPNCTDIYHFASPIPIPGAFFGKEWIHRFLTNHPEVTPKEPPESYEPRVFGFRVFLQKSHPKAIK